MASIHPTVQHVTETIVRRSESNRDDYLALMAREGKLDDLEGRELDSSSPGSMGTGRELFANFRRIVSLPEQGASVLFAGNGVE